MACVKAFSNKKKNLWSVDLQRIGNENRLERELNLRIGIRIEIVKIQMMPNPTQKSHSSVGTLTVLLYLHFNTTADAPFLQAPVLQDKTNVNVSRDNVCNVIFSDIHSLSDRAPTPASDQRCCNLPYLPTNGRRCCCHPHTLCRGSPQQSSQCKPHSWPICVPPSGQKQEKKDVGRGDPGETT